MQRKENDGALDLTLSLKLGGSPSDWAHRPEGIMQLNSKKRSLTLKSEASPSPSPSAFRDWADLPGSALQLILEKAKSITDYVRLRTVCSPWYSATLPMTRNLPPQLPWLMLPWDARVAKDDGVRLFYDLWEGKMRKLYLPGTMHTMCCASHRGWLFLAATIGEKIFLLNPLTLLRIDLPPFATRAKPRRSHPDDPLFEHRWYDPVLGAFEIKKVILSADPTDPNCLIMVFCRGSAQEFFCFRVKDRRWTRIMGGLYPLTGHPYHLTTYKDGTYYNGQFYLLYKDAMEIIDPNKPEDRIVYQFEPELAAVHKFLLEGKSGVYVVVPVRHARNFVVGTRDTKEDIGTCPKQKVELYQFQEHSLKLKKVSDISNTIIFCRNYACPYLAVCSEDWDSLDGGSMYMVCRCLYKDGREPSYAIVTTKLNDFKLKSVVSGVGRELKFCPSARPMWFQPSFF